MLVIIYTFYKIKIKNDYHFYLDNENHIHDYYLKR